MQLIICALFAVFSVNQAFRDFSQPQNSKSDPSYGSYQSRSLDEYEFGIKGNSSHFDCYAKINNDTFHLTVYNRTDDSDSANFTFTYVNTSDDSVTVSSTCYFTMTQYAKLIILITDKKDLFARGKQTIDYQPDATIPQLNHLWYTWQYQDVEMATVRCQIESSMDLNPLFERLKRETGRLSHKRQNLFSHERSENNFFF